MVACYTVYGRYAEEQRRSDTCRIRLLLVGQTDFRSRSLNGLGDTENSPTDGELTAKETKAETTVSTEQSIQGASISIPD